MSIEYEIYRKELINFIGTLTIKFSPFADIMATNQYLTTGVLITRNEDNPYYMHLCGQYHSSDEEMFVVSAETKELVRFDLTLRDRYPKTASLYKIDTDAYKTLVSKYPNQTDLIKSIVYPVVGMTINEIAALDDFTVLNGDYTLLHSNERESLRAAMDRYMNHIKTRWFIRDFDYEEYYPLAFFGVVIAELMQMLLAERAMNIKTVNVHPMHIWEYLSSKGLAEYRDILNDEQSLFLYRNIDYIRQNKGKKSNLVILAENLLKNLKVSLVNKTVLQNADLRKNDCRTVPEFLSEEVVNYSTYESIDEMTPETMDTILFRMFDEGSYPEYSPDDSSRMTEKFGETEFNVLPTRLYEFKKFTVDTRYLEMLLEFMLDTLLYRYKKGELNYDHSFKDPNTGVILKLTIPDLILLYHYCVHRESGVEPYRIPTLYTSRIAYVNKAPKMGKDIPYTYKYRGTSYEYDSHIDTKKILKDIPFYWGKITDAATFMDNVALQFSTLVSHVRDVRRIAHLQTMYAYTHFYSHLRVRETLEVKLTAYKNYDEWIAKTPGVIELLSAYADLPHSNKFITQLCDILLTQLFPVTSSSILIPFMGAVHDDTLFYAKMKKLFITLCSRRLTYLDTDRSTLTVFTFPNQATDNHDTHADGFNILDVSSDEHATWLDFTGESDFTRFTFNELHAHKSDVVTHHDLDYDSDFTLEGTTSHRYMYDDASTIKISSVDAEQSGSVVKLTCGSRICKSVL